MRRAGILLLIALWLAACRPLEVNPAPPSAATAAKQATADPPDATAAAVIAPTATAVPPTIAPTAMPAATAAPTAVATAPPSPTPDPYAPYTIDALAARSYGGGQLEIVDTLEQNERFTRYLIRYPSDGLTIYGYITVPNTGSHFPVAIVLHGYVPPAEYQTIAYTRRYVDALAEAGYFVIHPNLRNYPPSDEGPDTFRTGFAIDVLNLIAIVRAQSQDPTGTLRRADADNIHLWGHSMGGGVALRVVTVNNAPYIKAAVLYGSMSGDEVKNYTQIQQWSDGNRGTFELAAPPETLAAIAPIDQLDRITVPISIHHSSDDATVPVEWSEELCAALKAAAKAVECHFYDGPPHTFIPPWDDDFIARVLDFFARY